MLVLGVSRDKQVTDALATRERQVAWTEQLLDFTGSVALAQRVIDESTARKDAHGMLLDLTTAGAILAVAKALTPTNATRLDKMPVAKAGAIAWKLVR